MKLPATQIKKYGSNKLTVSIALWK